MSELLNEKVPRVPGTSRQAIEALARAFLLDFAHECLAKPTAVDLLALITGPLQDAGILFYPATAAELPAQYGATDPSGTGTITVLLREDKWDELALRGRRANHARSTVSHEIGHAILHVPYMRRVRALIPLAGGLNRVARDRLRPFEDPEWQAWAFAQAMLMPRDSFFQVASRPAAEIARIFNVSEQMVAMRFRSLQLRGK